MSDSIWITAMICMTVLCVFWMSLNQSGGGDDE